MRRLLVVALTSGAVAMGCLTSLASEAFPRAVDLESFEVVWRTIHEAYFDPTFGGVDWEAVRDQYWLHVKDAADSDEFYRLLNSMVFELERSHSAVIPPDSAGMVLPSGYAGGAVGLDVRWLSDEAVVVRVDSGSSADEAGIRPGFSISSFDGVPVQEIVAQAMAFLAPPFNERSTEETANSALLAQVYGEAGTQVVLTYRDRQGDLATVQLVRRARDRVSEPSPGMPPVYLDFASEWLQGDIGYVRFNTFHVDLLPDFAQAIASMREARGLILDLRGNPGGELDAMVGMTTYLLKDPAVIVTLVMRSQTAEVPAVPVDSAFRGPLVLLVDVRCTSGSEMLSISLQALGRAVVVGERTSGAVTGAGMIPLPNGALLMYPFVQTLAANGADPEGVGVTPDVLISLTRDQLLDGYDAQLQAAIDYLSGANSLQESLVVRVGGLIPDRVLHGG